MPQPTRLVAVEPGETQDLLLTWLRYTLETLPDVMLNEDAEGGPLLSVDTPSELVEFQHVDGDGWHVCTVIRTGRTSRSTYTFRFQPGTWSELRVTRDGLSSQLDELLKLVREAAA